MPPSQPGLGAAAAPGDVHEAVRAKYASLALTVLSSPQTAVTCCDSGCGEATNPEDFGSRLYEDRQRAELPEGALSASLGCGNPIAVADLKAGEVVLDLGSGGGIDVLLSARRVGPSGKAFGLDMTEEMLELARRNAAEAGAANTEFIKGKIEAIPLPPATVDVVISNCVVNLSPDKPAAIREMFRVLKPAGRIGISDVVAEDHLTASDRAARGGHVGCIAGALSMSEYRRSLGEAGFSDIEITLTHEVVDGMHGAIVRAVKRPGV